MRIALPALISFLRTKQASLPVITALVFIPMAVMAGGAVDFVMHERIRVGLQDALDRGVLASASLTQTGTSQDIVESYVKTVPSGGEAVLKVTDQRRANLHKVSARAKISYRTSFLHLMGIRDLEVVANSTASEARSNIEMSLVLDISGSMLDNGGMTQLRPAAKSFLDAILKEETKAVTSVSVVPFAGSVNLGEKVFDHFAGSKYVRRHSYSSCFEMTEPDFAAGAPAFPKRDQVSHFTYYNYNAGGKKPWWCPTDDASVTYLTNDLTYLKSRIDALQPFDGTGTAYGMKWAELFLNPSMQPSIQTIASKGLAPIPAAFTGRPAAFSDPDTLKFIVLMTDGQIGFQPRPTSTSNPAYGGKNISASGQSTMLYTEAQTSAHYKKVCSYARTEGITIFTIAFKVNAATAANIATCASDPSYAYKVDGLDMASAFQSIATTMQKLRLTN